MNRRDFLQTAVAAAAVPVLPTPVMATTRSAAPMGIAAKYWASYFATVEGQSALQAAHMSGAASMAEAKQLVMRSVARGGYSPGVAAVNTIGAGRNMAPRTPNLRRRVKAPVDDLPEELRNLRAPVKCHCMEPA